MNPQRPFRNAHQITAANRLNADDGGSAVNG
jgi:hypothetical protein